MKKYLKIYLMNFKNIPIGVIMNVLVSFEIKFRTNREKLIDLLKRFAFKRIQENLYFGDIDFDELFLMQSELMENIREYDSIIMIPICKSCYDKTNTFGRNLSFVEDLYKIF